VKSEPLTDAEFERLSGMLGRFDNKQLIDLEQLVALWEAVYDPAFYHIDSAGIVARNYGSLPR
jgi:hypothetical protein